MLLLNKRSLVVPRHILNVQQTQTSNSIKKSVKIMIKINCPVSVAVIKYTFKIPR